MFTNDVSKNELNRLISCDNEMHLFVDQCIHKCLDHLSYKSLHADQVSDKIISILERRLKGETIVNNPRAYLKTAIKNITKDIKQVEEISFDGLLIDFGQNDDYFIQSRIINRCMNEIFAQFKKLKHDDRIIFKYSFIKTNRQGNPHIRIIRKNLPHLQPRAIRHRINELREIFKNICLNHIDHL